MPFPQPAATTILSAGLLTLATGCSGEDVVLIGQPVSTAGAGGGEPVGAAGTAGTAPEGTAGDTPDPAGSVYALMINVYGVDESRTVYIYLSDTLDITPTLDQALEVPGVGNFAAIGGRLFISSGDAPVITEYEISPDLAFQKRRSVSFAAYPLDDNANFFYQFIVDERTAILPFDGASRIVWNPTDMLIDRVLEDSTLVMNRDGLDLLLGGNRGNASFQDGDVMQAFWYNDEDWSNFGSSSHIAVYDAETLAEKRIIDVACPGLSISTRVEDGSTYFSAFDMTVGSMQGAAVAPCIAKVAPDRTLEATWDLREWTGGHFAANFRYIGGGKAIANVFMHEELGVADVADLDPTALYDALWDEGPYWQLWLFDVESRTGQPVAGIDPNLAIDGWSSFSVVDDRTFLHLGYEGRSKVYEIDRTTSTAREHFDVTGEVGGWVRVR